MYDIISAEREIRVLGEKSPKEGDEMEKYLFDLMRRVSDGPGHYSEEKIELINKLN